MAKVKPKGRSETMRRELVGQVIESVDAENDELLIQTVHGVKLRVRPYDDGIALHYTLGRYYEEDLVK